jgi:sialic acid synthase SpsE/sugar phosphate isomerase/epimerase
MAELQLKGRVIGENHPCYIIAEIGLNHNGRLDYAKKLVDMACDAGFDAIKTQRRDLKGLYRSGILGNTEKADKGVQYVMPFLKKFELSNHDLVELKNYTIHKGIDFLCTPFDLPSLEFLIRDVGIDCVKIASADLVNIFMIKEVLRYGLPLLISTGMSTEQEIIFVYNFLKENNAKFACFHCNSNYPAPFAQINLRYMLRMKELFDVPVGYSGHELGIAVSIAAVAMGANMIERHITLDRTMEGPDHPASLEPPGFSKLVRDIRNTEKAMGGPRRFMSRGELMNRFTLGKSLVATREIHSEEIIKEEDVTVLSPGDGLSPLKYDMLIGKKINRNIKQHQPFLSMDLENVSSNIFKDVSFPYGCIARWHDLEFLLNNYKPKIIEIHMTAQDIEEVPALNGGFDTEIVIHMPEHYGNQLLDLCALDENVRSWSLERVTESAALLVNISKHFTKTPSRPKMVVHPGAMSVDGFLDEKSIMKQRDAMQRSLDELAPIDVDIMIENLPPYPWYLGGQWYTNYAMSSADMIEIVRDRSLGITYDISHSYLYCNWAKVDLDVEMKTLLPIIKHLHVSDASGIDGEGLQVGIGDVPWESIAPYIFSSGLVIVPEIWLGHLHGMSGMNEALFNLQKMWKSYKEIE